MSARYWSSNATTAPLTAPGNASSVRIVKTTDERDGALAVTVGLLDGTAQAFVFVRLAEQAASVALLLVGLVRSHHSNTAR